MYCPLGNSDRIGNISQPELRILRDTQEYMCMVG